jgi:membrane protease YdiL (CAAX protease family)
MAPIIEESLFRHTLYYLTSNWSYCVELNVILFSIIHLIGNNDNPILIRIFKCIFAIYLGYYLLSLNNILVAMLVHSVHNFFVISLLFIDNKYCQMIDLPSMQ